MNATPQKNRLTQLILPFVLLAGTIYLAGSAKAAVFPFVLSVALAYLINPVVVFFESRGFRRGHIVGTIYLLAGLTAFFALYSLYGLMLKEVELFQANWPVYLVKIKALAAGLPDRLAKSTPFPREMYNNLGALAGQKLASFAEALPMFIIGLIPGLVLVVLVPFITFFLLVDGHRMLDGFLDLLPSRHVEMSLHILSEIDQSLGNYLRGVLVDATILFALALVGLTWLQLEYAGAVAVIMGLSSLIPYVGPIVGAVLGGAAAFIQFSSITPVLQVLLLFVALRFIDDWFLQPFILERAVKVHPIVIVFSLLAGAELFGIWGVIFAMPVTCMLKVFLSIAIELQRSEFAWKPKPEPTRISIPYI
ncbi:MAG: AI-2E family transporter [Elusimicrobiales bacterium]|nr:AI-2E family transporter [Elusimicrobiales bacterium]